MMQYSPEVGPYGALQAVATPRRQQSGPTPSTLDAGATSTGDSSPHRPHEVQGPLKEPCCGLQPPAWLLRLPECAQELVLQQLVCKADLRLACKATQQLVDACMEELRFNDICQFKPGLAARFSRATKLKLVGDLLAWQCEGSHPLEKLSFAVSQIAAAGPWLAVTSLDVWDVPLEFARAMFAACPRLSTCLVNSFQTCARAVVHAMCSMCRHLSQVQLATSMSDAELLALASCSTLTTLELSMGDCSLGGWRTLMSMAQLRSLTLVVADGALPPQDLSLNLGSCTQLTHLTLKGKRQQEQDEAAMCAALQLPCSLREATLQRLPEALPRLQHMAKLNLVSSHGKLDTAMLLRLADACPGLAELQVSYMELTANCHAAPMTALTSLTVRRHVKVKEPVRLALLCPQLRSLTLCCKCDMVAGTGAFKGMQQLQSLDVGARAGHGSALEAELQWEGEGLSMHTGGFAVLAALPALRCLRCNLHPQHLRGVGRCMTQLTSITWACDTRFRVWDDLPRILSDVRVPEQVRKASFEFIYVEHGDYAQETLAYVEEVNAVADQCAWWLRRARPHLADVHWDAGSTCAILTDTRLSVVASSDSIRDVYITQDEYEHAAAIRDSNFQFIVNESYWRGVGINVHINGICITP